MTIEVPDIRGDLVTAGDTIAYAATDGRSGGMRIGKVVKIVPARMVEEYGVSRKKPARITVSVDFTSSIYNRAQGTNTSIDASLKRFVKVSA